ncbi:MAG: metal dependent phosphohydrolase, partial [Cyanobacteria bacterium RYN_339]|nr:metal dependent phosphohydrolase [Cyanobacteria bacterium RYN_339]
ALVGGAAPVPAAPPPVEPPIAVAAQSNVMRYYHNPTHFMPERSLMAAMQVVDEMDAQIRAGSAPVYSSLSRVVQEVIDRLGNNVAALNAGVEVRVVNQPHDRSHPVNVFILSVVIGLAMSYTPEQLLQLGIAALCHDIGKTAIPRDILDKVGTLAAQEVDLLRAHTLMGKRIMEKFPWADPVMARIIYEHHERNDGSGYPQKLQDRQIHEMSKIVAVAEVYDALMSDTSYRSRYKPEIAYNSIKVGDRSGLDPKVIRAFQRYVVPYPLNSWVVMETGEVAQVVQQNKQNAFKPIVRLNGTPVDLGDQSRYSIADSHFKAF